MFKGNFNSYLKYYSNKVKIKCNNDNQELNNPKVKFGVEYNKLRKINVLIKLQL